MERTTRIYFPLLRSWKWPRVNLAGIFRSFGEALGLYRKAISAAYLTAISFDRRNGLFLDEDLEGRDPRW